jgi:hypothetical protein
LLQTARLLALANLQSCARGRGQIAGLAAARSQARRQPDDFDPSPDQQPTPVATACRDDLVTDEILSFFSIIAPARRLELAARRRRCSATVATQSATARRGGGDFARSEKPLTSVGFQRAEIALSARGGRGSEKFSVLSKLHTGSAAFGSAADNHPPQWRGMF